MAHSTPLVTALGGNDTILRKVAMVLFGSVLVGMSAQVSVPMFPVPMTLQTLAISLIGLTYGARLAGATLIVYLAQGAMGFPLFAGGAAGAVHLVGPTGGFLIGFVAMAWLTGLMVERGLNRGFLRLFAAALVPGLLLFVPGVLWLWTITPLDMNGAIAAGAVPFVLGAFVKAAAAALIVTGAFAALKSRLG
ncbi:biotin transporter BioY [Roseinatronobacter bogoriensis]|jgi:biotin transport system substrate-specific component|uniref:Biotin transporter n=1 Tax=Roseinatronobacter bogoriensis subsp. barguzinensis TaxID=441209 RepID=A0A2K8KAF9_9RHOB|nr:MULTISPECIES: biotin transporter BioY [Rhodobaca]ATX66414.1 biotin transporter BioY [Rhodobaca barguzinensis]MBB4207555.1 biotin transport system substrate-specific component [Rhodobaca bogoriensis DSM 18756]TDW40138.1 biotin transport system substrate-specific component [Rhodobaca barguzinensis]TDY70710.1 biotin transport system substrate-specific component [Rhodobaca bogoriensis DSM 18756]